MKLQLDNSTYPVSAILVSDAIVVSSISDGLDLIGNADYLGAKHIVTSAEHFSERFFDLKTGLAGEVLQKFSNYKMKLTIQGEWAEVTSRALRDFIRECNRGDSVAFIGVEGS